MVFLLAIDSPTKDNMVHGTRRKSIVRLHTPTANKLRLDYNCCCYYCCDNKHGCWYISTVCKLRHLYIYLVITTVIISMYSGDGEST